MKTQPTSHKVTDRAESNAPRLSGTWLRVTHIAWKFAFGSALVILLLAIPAGILAVDQGVIGHGTGNVAFNTNYDPSMTDRVTTLAVLVVGYTAALLSLYLARILFQYRPDSPIAVFVSFFLLWIAVVASGPLEFMEFYIPGMANFTTDLLMSIWYAVLILMLMSLFPTGTFVPRWTRWIVLISLGLAPVYLLLYFHYGSLYSSPLYKLVTPFWALIMFDSFLRSVLSLSVCI